MPDCENCGDVLEDPRDKNAAGWWRDRCLPCIAADAQTAPADRPPIHESAAYQAWLAEQ